MPMGREPDVDPDIALNKIAREIRREYWRNTFDTTDFGHTTPNRKRWVDDKLREEGLL